MNPCLTRAIDGVLEWFAPRDCLGCSATLEASAEWCLACREQLESNDIAVLLGRRLIAPLRYCGPLRRSIHSLKYGERSDYAKRLIRALFPVGGYGISPTAVLVPVPLHPLRLVERGYNQSALLARALGKRWQLPVSFDLLHRWVPTQSQIGLGREQRAANVQNAFRADASRATDRDVWLVDDVVTSGATVLGCCTALEQIGVSVIGIVALGHATTTLSEADPAASDTGPSAPFVWDLLR